MRIHTHRMDYSLHTTLYSLTYKHDTTPNVVAMAVRTVMRICRTLLQMFALFVSISFS